MIDLFRPGAYARAAGGNLERPDLQAPVIDWMAWSINSDNGGGGDPKVWDRCRVLWERAGIQTFPWMHCRSMADINRLISVAKNYSSPAIGLNIESVVDDKLDLKMVSNVVQTLWDLPVHMATLCWVQNEQGWNNMAFAVAALEIFIDEVPACARTQDCIDHALAEGLPQVTLMFKTKNFQPSTYGDFYKICHSLYTADDITPTEAGWNLWRSTGECDHLVPDKQWYEKPYLTGPPVGPEKLPRALYPPSANKGTFTGDDVTAYKRGISRAGRLEPWNPATWNNAYGEQFAMGKGGGNVGTSGVRGFQRQTWPSDPTMQSGNMGDKTYQAMRRTLVSNPDSPHFREPIFDYQARVLLKRAAEDAFEDAKVIAFRKHLADFCERAENAATSAWTYTQQRPYTGLGVEPERNHLNDCSSYVILAWWWGRTKSSLAAPDPSGYQYDGYGNTWDNLDGNPTVTSGNYQVGDLAHYGAGGSGHVTICRKAGNKDTAVWSSFGGEPRPRALSLYYRNDFTKVVRPPLGLDV